MILVHAEAGKNTSNVMVKKLDLFGKFILSMKRLFLFVSLLMTSFSLYAQDNNSDTAGLSDNVVHKDSRIDVLGQKMAEYNLNLAKKTKMVNGFRLMLLNTTDRTLAMNARTKLIQLFPDQKLYTLFVTPYIKLKFGNFTSKDEAEDFKKQIMALKIVTGNIYIVSELIELKPTENTP